MGDLYKVLYDYNAQQSDELSLKTGDIVRLVQQDNQDWWTVQHNDTQQQGAVPSNFLEKVNASSSNPILAKVLQDYEAQDPDELTLWVNGIVTVLDQSIADGWWRGDLNGKIGVFPANHVKLIDAHEQDSEINEQDNTKRQSFKLAMYGVKQGGIGSILAGGLNLRKKQPKRDSISSEDSNQPVPLQPSNSKNIKDEGNTSDQNEKAMVISAYEPQNEDEIKLIPGGYITITDKLDNQGWWKGLNEQNEEGVFPSNFVQILPKNGTPVRPTRPARPPTIKTETNNTQSPPPLTSPTGMAKPPPIPGNRPTSLITKRPASNNATTISANSQSEQSPVLPPPRPITLPPIPTRRPSSLVKDNQQPSSKPTTHRRTPSIPLVSPDLPPIQQNLSNFDYHPVRPSRPVPPPTTTTSTQSTTSSTSSNSINELKSPTLAKPPKNYPAKPPGAVPPIPHSRPTSQASSIDSAMNDQRKSDEIPTPIPPARAPPKRTMPAIPTQPTITEQDTPTQEYDHQLGDDINDNDNNNTEESISPLPAPRNTIAGSSLKNNHPSKKINAEIDPLEIKFKQWFEEESAALQQHFTTLLEEEKNHRIRLENELELLKQKLNQM